MQALSFGTITIERSTFTGNRARAPAARSASASIAPTRPPDTAVLRFSTVVDNEADTDGDGIGGIRSSTPAAAAAASSSATRPGRTTLEGSIVAGNLDSGPDEAPDLDGLDFVRSATTSLGVRRGNVASAFPAGQPNANDDWVGTLGAPLAHGLQALAENGGPTPSRLPDLAAGPSLVIDHGSCPGEIADQRGFANPASAGRAVDEPSVVDADDGCDIGAVELGAVLPLLFSDGFESQDTSRWSLSVP